MRESHALVVRPDTAGLVKRVWENYWELPDIW